MLFCKRYLLMLIRFESKNWVSLRFKRKEKMLVLFSFLLIIVMFCLFSELIILFYLLLGLMYVSCVFGLQMMLVRFFVEMRILFLMLECLGFGLCFLFLMVNFMFGYVLRICMVVVIFVVECGSIRQVGLMLCRVVDQQELIFEWQGIESLEEIW